MPVAPLHCFRASTAGTGKSYLVDLASVIATGAQCPVISASSDERENEKRLVGLLLGGFPIVSLDNVNGELGGDLLCQAVERPLVRLRPMGKSDIREIETRATLFATGNGLRVRGDMTRRALLCTLDAQTERPEMRTFSFDPLQRVLENRGAYVAAAITVVRSFHTAGRPGLRPPIGSYREWSDVVRSALVWLGQPDPVDSMEAAREDDPELSDLRDLMTAWRGCPSIGADSRPLRDVAEIAERRELLDGGGSGGLLYPDLRNELLRIAGARDGIDTKKLGKWIKARERRLVSITSDDGTTATARFIRDGNAKGGVVKWRLDARA
jgi:putative DNA primase/helicase